MSTFCCFKSSDNQVTSASEKRGMKNKKNVKSELDLLSQQRQMVYESGVLDSGIDFEHVEELRKYETHKKQPNYCTTGDENTVRLVITSLIVAGSILNLFTLG
jgi:hypothetical protein